MIDRTQADLRESEEAVHTPYRRRRLAANAAETKPSTPYGAPFWFAYVANASLVTANALLTRYVEFVRQHEPDSFEFYLGAIVGVGMVGSLLMRLSQGGAMDRYGPRLMWICSAVIFSLSCFGHLAAEAIAGSSLFWPCIYFLRIVMTTSLAGCFGASMVYISQRVPPHRMAEMVGTLGTSGFVGLVAGPVLGDLLFDTALSHHWQVTAMFVAAGLLSLTSGLFATLATWHLVPPARKRHTPATWKVVWKYFPGPVVLVGIGMGVGMVFPLNFLADFAHGLENSNIGLFFTVYAVTAFVVRVSIRRFAENYGIDRMVYIGLTLQTLAYLLYLTVFAQWQLIFPALAAGCAHAFLFPAVVAGGGMAFPERYRGIGTTLMMGCMDFGMLVGGPALGWILDTAGKLGWPRYAVVFVCVASFLFSMMTAYAMLRRAKRATG